MIDQKTMTGNCIRLTWKMKDQIAPYHLNIITIYSIYRTATAV